MKSDYWQMIAGRLILAHTHTHSLDISVCGHKRREGRFPSEVRLARRSLFPVANSRVPMDTYRFWRTSVCVSVCVLPQAKPTPAITCEHTYTARLRFIFSAKGRAARTPERCEIRTRMQLSLLPVILSSSRFKRRHTKR